MDQVPDVPAPIRRLNSLFSAALIVHEAIFEISGELAGSADVARIEPELRLLMGRQRRIAMQLRSMLDR
jgi:hypothetical protein